MMKAIGEMINLSQEAPNHLVNARKQKVEDFKEFIENIDFAIVKITLEIQEVIEKLKKHIYSKEFTKGFLVKTIEKYTNCFGEIKRGELLDLLRSDLSHWED